MPNDNHNSGLGNPCDISTNITCIDITWIWHYLWFDVESEMDVENFNPCNNHETCHHQHASVNGSLLLPYTFMSTLAKFSDPNPSFKLDSVTVQSQEPSILVVD